MTVWDEMKLLHLASSTSFWRGMNYFQEEKVIDKIKVDDNSFFGYVKGSDNSKYEVTINLKQPRKSRCTCLFAKGRRVVCKHQVALYFSNFPEYASRVLQEQEEREREKEERYNKYLKEVQKSYDKKYKEVDEYVQSLSESELREELLRLLMEEYERERDDEDYYDEDYFDDDDYDYFY